MNRRLRDTLLLLIVAAAVVLPRLGSTRFWDEDEGFFAGAAAEMYARGDWIVPYFNGELFGHKPPWMYWMMMVGFETFGVTEFAARFYSAVFGMAAAWMTYLCGRRLFNPRVGLIAAIAVITSLMFSVVSRAATADSYLVFFSTLALYLFTSQGFAKQHEPAADAGELTVDQGHYLPQRWASFALLYAVLGLGALVKGPIGVVLPMAVIGMFLLCMTPRRDIAADASRWARLREALRPFGPANFLRTVWRMRPLTALAMVLLVAGPWFLAVGMRTHGAFLREFFLVHNFQRFSSAMENHNGSVLYYPLSMLVGMFPWSVFTVPAAILAARMIRRREQAAAVTFLICWAGVYMGLLSLAATKLPNYVLPAYPALALLCGVLIDRWLRRPFDVPVGWIRIGLACLVVVGLGIAIGLPLAGTVEINGQTLLDRVNVAHGLQRETRWLGLLGAPLVVGGALAIALSWRLSARYSVLTVGATALATMLVLWNFVAPRIDRLQTPQDLAAFVRQHCEGTDVRVAQLGLFRPTMVFYSGHQIAMCDNPAEAREFLSSPQPGLLITTDWQLARLQGTLPADIVVIQRRPQFPKQGEIVLLGRSPATARRPSEAEHR